MFLDFRHGLLDVDGLATLAAKFEVLRDQYFDAPYGGEDFSALRLNAQVPTRIAAGQIAPDADQTRPVKFMLADEKTRERRRAILRRYQESNKNMTRADLERHFAMSITAIDGMIRGDRSRYSEARLRTFLQMLGVDPEQW